MVCASLCAQSSAVCVIAQGLQAGLQDGQSDRRHCPRITAEGLPDDPEDTSPKPDTDKSADDVKPHATFEEGCFVTFEVDGDVPDKMPQNRALRTLLGAGQGLAFVQYDPVCTRRFLLAVWHRLHMHMCVCAKTSISPVVQA